MAEQRVHRRHATAKRRMIDRIIVHECREVDQLESGRECDRLLFRSSFHFARQQQQRRPEQLAAHRKQVRADLAYEGELARDDRSHRARHIIELVADGELNRLERRRWSQCDVHASVVVGSGRYHFEAALVICLRRLLTSRKSMSIANTRW